MFSCDVETGICTNWPVRFDVELDQHLEGDLPAGYVAGTVHVPVHGMLFDRPGACGSYLSLTFGWFGIVT